MMLSLTRLTSWFVAASVIIILLLHLRPFQTSQPTPLSSTDTIYRLPQNSQGDPSKFKWSERKEHYPVSEYLQIPAPSVRQLPRIQHNFEKDNALDRSTRRQRQAQVKSAMRRCWDAYQRKAWLLDELAPISGGNKTTYGGWAATLVDSLDTLWIMDMKDEFRHAVNAIVSIDFTATTMETINVFETTIRYMGGFIAAYDLSGDQRLLDKSLELADMIYAAFDTPNRVPILRWNFHAAAAGKKQTAPDSIILAEIGSLCLEFTRLAQITHDPKWYDAIARISNKFEKQQYNSRLPGMWPLHVNGEKADFASGDTFSLAAFSDSMYEYLPKMYALLRGSEQYAKMYTGAMETALKHAFYRPMVAQEDDNIKNIIAPGTLRVKDGPPTIQPELQHLVCFVGGMLALGGKLMGNESHVEYGRKVTNLCVWAYGMHKHGIMPENSNLVPCPGLNHKPCDWDVKTWHEAVWNDAIGEERQKNATTLIQELRLPKGFSAVPDRKYHLRPEAIESVFVLYRITGDKTLLEDAWNMFRSIHAQTRTDLANAALLDVTNGTKATQMDNMESFWTAETLKYFYLIFSEPDVISLDEYVFNTEAHPFRLQGHRGSLLS